MIENQEIRENTTTDPEPEPEETQIVTKTMNKGKPYTRKFMTAARRCGPNTVGEKLRRQQALEDKLANYKYIPYLQRPEVVRHRVCEKLARFQYTPRKTKSTSQEEPERGHEQSQHVRRWTCSEP